MSMPLIVLANLRLRLAASSSWSGRRLPGRGADFDVHGSSSQSSARTGLDLDAFTDRLTYALDRRGVLGIGLAYFVYYKKSVSLAWATKGAKKKVYDLLLNRYYFPRGYDAFGVKVIYGFSRAIDWFDRRVIDGIVNGSAAWPS